MFIPAQTTPTRQVFSPRDVHILKQPPLSNDALEGAMACLSENEQRRAADFVFDDDRRRFVTGRYILRHFLAEILKVTPAEVALLTSPLGKPWICHDHPLFFNLSHSGDWVLIAFSHLDEIGVDVQIRHPAARIRRMTADFINPKEHRSLGELSSEQEETMLHLLWAGKEAALKALGCGLARDPTSINFAGLLTTDAWTAVKGEALIVRALPLDIAHVAAVAVLQRHISAAPCITYSQLKVLAHHPDCKPT